IPRGGLEARAWWSVGTFLLWCVIPALLGRVVLGRSVADFGLKFKGAFADGWIYVAMFLLVGPLVPLMARRQSFQATYPFYMPAPGLGPDFWAWEACYAFQFVAVEFFFRGWLIHGLKHRLGSACIPVMTIPYVMIHFGKPLPETIGAILAGLALGFMSLKNRSIVMGAVLHVAVAVSMDLCALYQKGYFD